MYGDYDGDGFSELYEYYSENSTKKFTGSFEYLPEPQTPRSIPQEIATEMVSHAKNNVMHLRKISVKEGVIIRNALVEDCIRDCAMNNGLIKSVLAGVNNLLEPFKREQSFCLKSPVREDPWNSLSITPSLSTESENLNYSILLHSSIPTSQKDDHHKELNNLTNINYQISEKGQHISITCGGIDNKLKADEFIEAVLNTLRKRKSLGKRKTPHSLRVILHQVNSFTNDRKLLENQHQFSRYIETELSAIFAYESQQDRHGITWNKDSPIVAHVNLALNFASTLYGSVEDATSKVQNLEGLAAEVIWLLEDLEAKMASFSIPNENLEVLLGFKSTLLKARFAVMQIKDQNGLAEQLIDSQSILQSELKNVLLQIHQFENEMSILSAEGAILKAKFKLLSLILAKQLDSLHLINQPYFSRVTELELHLLLDFEMDCITEINCKSGIDRTGFARSILDALYSLQRQFYNENTRTKCSYREGWALAHLEMIDFVLNQDAAISVLDDIQYQLAISPEISPFISNDLKNVMKTSEVPTFHLRDKIVEAVKERCADDQKLQKQILNILNYHDFVLANMFSVAQVITLESTGVPGLKYGQDGGYFQSCAANPHPLKRIPMFITTKEGKIIQIIDTRYSLFPDDSFITDIIQTKRNFTQAGMELILRNSSKRGA